MSVEKPWEDFVDPVTAPASGSAPAAGAPATPEVGYAEDIAKGAAGGLGRGVAGTVGLPGTVGGWVRSGLSKAGVPDEYLDKGASIARYLPTIGAFTGPNAGQVQQHMEGVTGKFYEPKTVPGQYASTIAEFAPGALVPGGSAGSFAKTLGAKTLNTVLPAITSETAGQLTKGTAAEPWARAIGGVGGGVVGAKAITPAAPASAARQAAVDVLEREGIPVTAGQRTGSKPIQWMEATAADMPGSAERARQLQSAQKSAFDRAITERTFDRRELSWRGVPADVNLPDPRVARAGPKSLSEEYTRLTQNPLVSNPQLQNRMTRAQQEYERLVLPYERNTNVSQARSDIIDRLVAGQGRMAGDEYQSIRSQLRMSAKGAANPQEAHALREYKYALDEAMQAGLSPAEARAWALNNQRYANMKQLEGAVAAGGENLSPARVAQGARAGRNAQYAAQTGNLDELTNAAALIMKDLPQSGTAPRTAMQSLFNIPAWLAAGGGGAAGSMFGPVGAAVGAAVPFAAARAVVSRPGQAYLGNQALPQRARDVLAQTLAEQAISQPSGIVRNTREQEEYEKKRPRIHVYARPGEGVR